MTSELKLFLRVHTSKYTQLFVALILLVFYVFYTVPTPNVSVTAPNTQTVGQLLTLQCEVTTVRGITSRVDIVWSSDGREPDRTDGISSITMNNSLIYTDSYIISPLSTADENRVYECEVVINFTPSVMASNSVTLDVTGKYCIFTMSFDFIH